jgi:ABC-type phosphate/phosphonate transport system substrate-binding protein
MQDYPETRIRLRNLAMSLAVFAGLFAIAWSYAVPVLRLSVVPDEPPFVIRRQIKPLTEYLEQKVGMKVEFMPMRDGNALVDALLADKLDIVWLDGPGLARAQSLSNSGVIPIARRAEQERASAASAVKPDGSYRWAVRAGMDGELRQKLTDAFLTMHADNGKGSEFLQYQHVSRYLPAQ